MRPFPGCCACTGSRIRPTSCASRSRPPTRVSRSSGWTTTPRTAAAIRALSAARTSCPLWSSTVRWWRTLRASSSGSSGSRPTRRSYPADPAQHAHVVAVHSSGSTRSGSGRRTRSWPSWRTAPGSRPDRRARAADGRLAAAVRIAAGPGAIICSATTSAPPTCARTRSWRMRAAGRPATTRSFHLVLDEHLQLDGYPRLAAVARASGREAAGLGEAERYTPAKREGEVRGRLDHLLHGGDPQDPDDRRPVARLVGDQAGAGAGGGHRRGPRSAPQQAAAAAALAAPRPRRRRRRLQGRTVPAGRRRDA